MALQLSVLGTGHMASAILDGVFDHGILSPGEVRLYDRSPRRLERFSELGCGIADSAGELADSSRILCAVRPQEFPDAAVELGGLSADHLLISVMAGVDSSTISRLLGGDCRVVRTMPNAGALFGCSMTAVSAGHGAGDSDVEFVNSLFDAIGRTVDVDERLLSAATAVSGSGPGWVFLLASSMIAGAVDVGVSAADADVMVRQTIVGAAKLLEQDDSTVEALLAGITSRGGTTEAGLAAMRDAGFVDSVREGIVAARDRGDVLGRSDQ